jgi:hypothetical protein
LRHSLLTGEGEGPNPIHGAKEVFDHRQWRA